MGVQLQNIELEFWARFGKDHAVITHQIARVILILDSEGRVYCLTFLGPNQFTRLSLSKHTTNAVIRNVVIV